MTKKERVLAVMKKEQVDMIPAGFWFHYKSDYTVQQMIDEHMKLFRTTDMDIIKIMQDYPYPISGKITCADDWYHIQVKGTDSEEFAKMAEIIRGIRKEAGKDVLIFQTMFGPFKAASMTFGDDVLMKYSKEAPEAVAAGVKIIADALEEWTKGYLEAGADGIYYSAQFGEIGRFEKNEWEETNSNEQGPESRISVTSYTPVYEYTVNGQQYEYHTRLGSSTDQYPIGKECPGYYNPKNPADVTETLKEITGGGSHFLSLLFFGIGVLAILFALIRVWAVITLI